MDVKQRETISQYERLDLVKINSKKWQVAHVMPGCTKFYIRTSEKAAKAAFAAILAGETVPQVIQPKPAKAAKADTTQTTDQE
ncbi:MAG: hypothetical protein ACXWW0_00160 [Bacteroidia bacterium]